MTSARLNIVILVLWTVLAALIISITFNAPHFSPWEFFIPAVDPVTWIAPTLLVGPPIFLLLAWIGPTKMSLSLGWVIAALLALVIAAIFAVFSPSAYLGS